MSAPEVFLRVFATLRAAGCRFADPLFFAAALTCAETALGEAFRVLSRRNAFNEAWDPLRELSEIFLPCCFLVTCCPAPGLLGLGGSLTPAFRAFDNPTAIACFTDRAPCLRSISSRTNSPACVDGALPSLASSRALRITFSSGIPPPLVRSLLARHPSNLVLCPLNIFRPWRVNPERRGQSN